MNGSQEQRSGDGKGAKARPIVSTVLGDGTIIETLFNPEVPQTTFCVAKDGEWHLARDFMNGTERLVPYSARNELVRHQVVLLPSEPAEYASEAALVEAVREHIHRYVDLSPRFEELASYYVLFTWVHDQFEELPYLRVRADFGSGKTRFLRTVGPLCYKPIFTGASTVSPIFRILHEIGGTLVVDEADLETSDERAEMVKILNNGNAKDFPVLRSEKTRHGEFEARPYQVFGPKIVATRGFFDDPALESRFIVEEMGRGRLREDVPIRLPPTWRSEALALRNQLLTFRLRTFGRHRDDQAVIDRGLEPRMNQILGPLMAVIPEGAARDRLRELARELQRDAIASRGMEMEAQVLEMIRDALADPFAEMPAIQDITKRFVDLHGEEYDRKVTPKWIGSIVRKKLQLKTRKVQGKYVIPVSELPKLQRLYDRYGLAADPRAEVEDAAPETMDPEAGGETPAGG